MDKQAQDRFVRMVFRLLPPLPEEDQHLYEPFASEVRRKGEEGWTVAECRQYLMTTEEFNPSRPEDEAPRERALLEESVQRRLRTG